MSNKYNIINLENKIRYFWKKNIFYNFYKKYQINNYLNKSVSILLPPPNITGNLHLGHALQYTLMDIIIRYNKMLKNNILWQSGLDHAGIATQLVVEKILIKINKIKSINYKKQIINLIKKCKTKYASQIKKQMQYLGCYINWDNYRFTMDKEYSIAVNKAFIKLYENKLIYKAKKLVNWDPVLKTAISDLEVEYIIDNGYIWYIKYFILDNYNKITNNYIIISTTRPETLLGDVAIAINPLDIEYNKFIGKFAIVPIINRIIPIIGDNSIKINKYSGGVKITPGHDFNDYELSKKYNLPIISIFNKKAKTYIYIKIYKNYLDKKPIYEYIPLELQNLNRFILRKEIIKKLYLLKLLIKIEKILIKKPINSRNNIIIEPRLTNQWYLKTKSLSKLAFKAVKNNKIKFLSYKYKKIYFSWLKNIQDWCISRQIIWGHKIPIWYDNNDNIYVGENELIIRKKYNLNYNIKLSSEKDVLDTWFSSSLWSFASLGWPNFNSLFKYFLPTTILISGFDIIFFWIIKMIMMTMYLIKNKYGKAQIPFKNIFITGLICDNKGNKMSKSKDNVIDPIDLIKGITLKKLIIKKINNLTIKNKYSINKIINNTKKEFPIGIKTYGADVLRLTLTSISTVNNRIIKWNMNKLDIYTFLCNKLWNVSIFILLNVKKIPIINNYYQKISILDYWILFKLNLTIKIITQALNEYKFDIIINTLYKFIKIFLCDWYIELIKPILFKNIHLKYVNKIKIIKLTLLIILNKIIKLAHPIIPYITDLIWQKLFIFRKVNNVNKKYFSIIQSNYPIYNKKIKKNHIINDIFNIIKELIIGCRNYRNTRKINNKILFTNIILNNITKKNKLFIITYKSLLINLLKTKNIIFKCNLKININKYSINNIIMKNIKFIIIIKKKILKKNNNNLNNELFIKIKKINYIINICKNKLKNKYFIKNAPKLIIIKVLKKYKNNNNLLKNFKYQINN